MLKSRGTEFLMKSRSRGFNQVRCRCGRLRLLDYIIELCGLRFFWARCPAKLLASAKFLTNYSCQLFCFSEQTN